jgi:hypothetical protein
MIVEEFLWKTNPSVVLVGFLVFVFLFQFPSLMIHAFAALGCCVVVNVIFPFPASVFDLARSPARSAMREIVSE